MSTTINTAKVSIVVPVFGVEDYLSECIESIINQTYKNLEIILVNDGSKDNCEKIISNYQAKDKRIVSLKKENGGLVSARKAGVELATGKYLTFVDGDDWIEPKHIEGFLEIELNNVDLVICGFKRDFFGKRREFKCNFDEGYYDENSLNELILPNAIHHNIIEEHGISTYVWNKLFLTQKVRKFIKEIDNQIVMGEDSCLTYPYLFNSKKIYISSKTSYIYRQRSSSIIKSIKNRNEEFNRLSLVFSYLISSLNKNNLNENIHYQLEKYFLTLICVRSGGIFLYKDSEPFLPFLNFNYKKDSKVAIYCSGSFGQHLHSALKLIPKIDIVGWLDEDYIESKKENLDVYPPETVQSLIFDKILIASVNKYRIEEITSLLDEYGISSAQIAHVDINLSAYKKYLNMIGFDLETFNFIAK